MQVSSFFVTGGTGNQGGAVARNLAVKGFKVKVLTRNASSPAAQNLAKQNIEVVEGNLNDPATYRQYLQDVDGVFGVLSFEYGAEKEIKQGIELVSLAKEFNVRHFIYSSVAGGNMNTGIPHWHSKAEIEKAVQESGLHYTILRPASLYENFLIPQVKGRLLKGKLVSPINKNILQQFIGTEDIGRISTVIFTDPGNFDGRIITLAAEQLDLVQVAQVFSQVMGKEIKYQKLPALITRLAMGKSLYKMFQWINKNGGVFTTNTQELYKEFPGMQSLRQWIQLNFK